ncbi:MAG TPA: hypothetical protein DD979_09585 [Gammaproteobacteria bacterium]|nr:hypothetical protein [Gammaproteobacteria bacterium]
MRRWSRRYRSALKPLSLMIALAATTACSIAPTPKIDTQPQPTATPGCTDRYHWLETYAQIPPDALNQEVALIDQALTEQNNACTRLRFAILMATPRAAVQSDGRAILLYDALRNDPSLSPADQRFVNAQLAHIRQREKLRRQALALGERCADKHRSPPGNAQ